MSEDNQQEKKPRESLEEFSKRLGLKHIKEEGGVEISPYHGVNLLPKRPKQAKKQPKSVQEFWQGARDSHEQQAGRRGVRTVPRWAPSHEETEAEFQRKTL
jgi:hypothetical protein